MTARTASAITAVLGLLYAAVSVVFDPDTVSALRNFGIGLAVAGAGWLAHGLCGWLDDRPAPVKPDELQTLITTGQYERKAS